MARFKALLGLAQQVEADALIVNLFQEERELAGATRAVDEALTGLLSQIIAEEQFKAELGQVLLVHTQGRIPTKRVLVAGLGKRGEFALASISRASAAAAKRASSVHARRVATVVHGAGQAGLDAAECAQATVEGTMLGCYRFTKYKTKGEPPREIEEVTIVERDGQKLAAIKTGIRRGQIFARAAMYARDLVNEPAEYMTPAALAREAEKVARRAGLACQIFGSGEMKRMGMGALMGVAQGSAQPPALIKLVYKPKGRVTRKVALVGKGVTFDSGGLDIKSADSMATMKDDMSGAATVLAVMSTLAELQPRVEVTGLLAAAENMPGPKAYRPGDVLRAYNGKTIEISNTDAEGRLLLADALAYVAKAGAEEIIDIATLTGACIVALGSTASGIMGNDQGLIERLMKIGSKAGEKLWQLPLYDEYRELLKSEVADIKNSGSREAGASQGGIFLKEFVDDKKWAHLDIAGTSFLEREREDCPKGGTGVGVRTLLYYLLEMGKD